jgi:hypothetical protein
MNRKIKFDIIITVILFLFIILTDYTFAQAYKAEKVKGIVKAQIGASEKWSEVKNGMELNVNTIIYTAKNSSLQIANSDTKFTLKENSVVSVSSIKKMTLDELILALAMEDMINAPKKNDKSNSANTAVYGSEEKGDKKLIAGDDNFGIKRLNGAMQLSENGFKESSIVAAKETYRKYPKSKFNAGMRIYFANDLSDLGLYEEAYNEFNSIKSLSLSDQQKKEVDDKLSFLNKKLISVQ